MLVFSDQGGEFLVLSQQAAEFLEDAHDGDVDKDGRLFKTLESMATPSSVNAYGGYFECSPRFKVSD
jgi:hypothetical protein